MGKGNPDSTAPVKRKRLRHASSSALVAKRPRTRNMSLQELAEIEVIF